MRTHLYTARIVVRITYLIIAIIIIIIRITIYFHLLLVFSFIFFVNELKWDLFL